MSPSDSPTKQELLDLLLDAFPRPEDMEMLLALRLDKNFAALARTGSYETDLFRVLQAADAQGWLEDFLHGACKERPLREDLKEAVDAYLANQTQPVVARPVKDTPTRESAGQRGAGEIPRLARMLHKGMSGEDVKALQDRLFVLGLIKMVDGIFGPATDNAVKEFQRQNSIAPDGIVGPQTWALLWQGG
jgi:peptidoglycan hydrolase-like protein with peptidoglycan-binding domain